MQSDKDSLLQGILWKLVKRNTPVVTHNGLLDMVFFYQSFLGTLPEKLDIFVADLTILFPAGLFDTKYIAEYETRENASFLAYLGRK